MADMQEADCFSDPGSKIQKTYKKIKKRRKKTNQFKMKKNNPHVERILLNNKQELLNVTQ